MIFQFFVSIRDSKCTGNYACTHENVTNVALVGANIINMT